MRAAGESQHGVMFLCTFCECVLVIGAGSKAVRADTSGACIWYVLDITTCACLHCRPHVWSCSLSQSSHTVSVCTPYLLAPLLLLLLLQVCCFC
jgi:hypothetical protein